LIDTCDGAPDEEQCDTDLSGGACHDGQEQNEPVSTKQRSTVANTFDRRNIGS